MTYLMAGRSDELERLRLQSLVWEAAGRTLLERLRRRRACRALDLGCGALGWLRILSEWVGPGGSVVGTDIDDRLLALAGDFVDQERLGNVELVHDDLFATRLPHGTFDLVHARFQVAPLGRADEILDAMVDLCAPDGVVVLEDPDHSSWGYDPPAPALERLVELIVECFTASGGEFDAGRRHVARLRSRGFVPEVSAEVVVLEPGNPYLALPVQFSRSLEPRLLQLVDATELDALRVRAEAELTDETRWGTTFTLLQTVGRRPEGAPHGLADSPGQ